MCNRAQSALTSTCHGSSCGVPEVLAAGVTADSAAEEVDSAAREPLEPLADDALDAASSGTRLMLSTVATKGQRRRRGLLDRAGGGSAHEGPAADMGSPAELCDRRYASVG